MGFLSFFRKSKNVSVIPLNGIIAPNMGRRKGLNLNEIDKNIEQAFSVKNLKAVALQINLPGGSPVQSEMISQRIRSLSEKNNVPVLAFIEDVAASGGYWLAISGDEIFVDSNSIIGSIGVVYSGFGFSNALEKLGVERRLHTAGERKAMLDPFSPERPADIEKLKEIQNQMHENFMDIVKLRRGQRLKSEKTDLFSGEFWLGKQAIELGLVDGLGELVSVLKERFGEDVKLRRISLRRGWFRRRFSILGFSPVDHENLGGSFASGAISAIESRSLWARFGL